VQLLSRTQAHRWTWRRYWPVWLPCFYSQVSSWTKNQMLYANSHLRNRFFVPTIVWYKKTRLSGCKFSWAHFWLCHLPTYGVCLCFACWFATKSGFREILFECRSLPLDNLIIFIKVYLLHKYAIYSLFICLRCPEIILPSASNDTVICFT
jgi:hypothetical protein